MDRNILANKLRLKSRHLREQIHRRLDFFAQTFIDDLIVNTDSGDIIYIVVKTNFDDGEHLIPVPLSLLQWDATNQAFVLNVEAAMLQNALSLKNNEFPDMTMSDWNSEFDSFWQNNGTGTGSQATPTP